MEQVIHHKTSKGKDSISYNGYTYREERTNNKGERFWRCIDKKCSGRIKTSDQLEQATERTEHNHLPDRDNGSIRQMMTAVRERSLTETTSIKSVKTQSTRYAERVRS